MQIDLLANMLQQQQRSPRPAGLQSHLRGDFLGTYGVELRMRSAQVLIGSAKDGFLTTSLSV